MIFTRITILVIWILCNCEMCLAGGYPQDWPWIGVTVNNLSSTPIDIRNIKKRLPATNAIRLTLKPRLLAQRKGLDSLIALEKTLDWADVMLDACYDNDIRCIVSISQFPIDPKLGFTQSDPKFWHEEKQHVQVISIVAKLAKRFSGRGEELVAFEVLNEPEVRIKQRVTRPERWPGLL